jgi:hypothetical protein
MDPNLRKAHNLAQTEDDEAGAPPAGVLRYTFGTPRQCVTLHS